MEETWVADLSEWKADEPEIFVWHPAEIDDGELKTITYGLAVIGQEPPPRAKRIAAVHPGGQAEVDRFFDEHPTVDKQLGKIARARAA